MRANPNSIGTDTSRMARKQLAGWRKGIRVLVGLTSRMFSSDVHVPTCEVLAGPHSPYSSQWLARRGSGESWRRGLTTIDFATLGACGPLRPPAVDPDAHHTRTTWWHGPLWYILVFGEIPGRLWPVNEAENIHTARKRRTRGLECRLARTTLLPAGETRWAGP